MQLTTPRTYYQALARAMMTMTRNPDRSPISALKDAARQSGIHHGTPFRDFLQWASGPGLNDASGNRIVIGTLMDALPQDEQIAFAVAICKHLGARIIDEALVLQLEYIRMNHVALDNEPEWWAAHDRLMTALGRWRQRCDGMPIYAAFVQEVAS